MVKPDVRWESRWKRKRPCKPKGKGDRTTRPPHEISLCKTILHQNGPRRKGLIAHFPELV